MKYLYPAIILYMKGYLHQTLLLLYLLKKLFKRYCIWWIQHCKCSFLFNYVDQKMMFLIEFLMFRWCMYLSKSIKRLQIKVRTECCIKPYWHLLQLFKLRQGFIFYTFAIFVVTFCCFCNFELCFLKGFSLWSAGL